MSLLTQQPRWLLLSVFLIAWSWSSVFRRDGSRAQALGLGVDARIPPYEGAWNEKRLAGLPPCADTCAVNASATLGCSTVLMFSCVCHFEQFLPDTVNCMTTACNASDKAEGQATLEAACKQVGTSTSVPISFSVSSTSIGSGIPSRSTSLTLTVPPISSGTITATIPISVSVSATTVTVTASASASSTDPATSVSNSATVPSSSTPTSTPLPSQTTVTQTSTLASSSSASAGSSNGASSVAHGVPVGALLSAMLAMFVVCGI